MLSGDLLPSILSISPSDYPGLLSLIRLICGIKEIVVFGGWVGIVCFFLLFVLSDWTERVRVLLINGCPAQLCITGIIVGTAIRAN